jgi:3-oxoacyl-[acyl-carrier protein] reductase
MPQGYYTYASSKAALISYSQDIARDNAPRGICIYVVAPGPVEGKMFAGLRSDIREQCLASMPTGKPVKLQEVVDMIAHVASGKVPSATGGVFDLMGASYRH